MAISFVGAGNTTGNSLGISGVQEDDLVFVHVAWNFDSSPAQIVSGWNLVLEQETTGAGDEIRSGVFRQWVPSTGLTTTGTWVTSSGGQAADGLTWVAFRGVGAYTNALYTRQDTATGIVVYPAQTLHPDGVGHWIVCFGAHKVLSTRFRNASFYPTATTRRANTRFSAADSETTDHIATYSSTTVRTTDWPGFNQDVGDVVDGKSIGITLQLVENSLAGGHPAIRRHGQIWTPDRSIVRPVEIGRTNSIIARVA